MPVQKDPIVSDIEEEIAEFPETDVELDEGLKFNHAETLRRINFYNNNTFESGPQDSEGFRKSFFNITDSPLGTARKSTDVDTKDFRFIPEDGQPAFPAWLITKEFKLWVKEHPFAQTLNDIVH